MSFFFNDTATTEIYTLSLHDALPICPLGCHRPRVPDYMVFERLVQILVFSCAYWMIVDEECSASTLRRRRNEWIRSEEHTSELQSRQYLVCRLLLEKKKKQCRHDCLE